MSEKRRDNRNRILRNGESQRKDGRYAFKYIDATGKPQFVYSWKLEKTDKLPTGKRDDLSLLEKEKLIQKDIDDQIVPRGGEMSVEELVRKYLMQKAGVRHNTEANYNFVLNIIKKEEFGKRRIEKVKQSDAKCWLMKLQQDGRGYSSIHSIRGVVRPAFQMAVDDDRISTLGPRKSPETTTVSVHKDVFSYERLVATSVMEAAAFSLSMVDHGLDDSAIASISFMVARSTSPTPVK